MKFLFALLGVAVATYSSLPLNQPLVPRTEYLFRFESQVASGIPSGSDDSITRFNCDTRLQLTTDRSATLSLENCKISHSINQSPSGKFISFDVLEKREISSEHMAFFEMPVTFHYKNGLVSDLQFSAEEPVWTANIKRSVINMLQINLQKTGSNKFEGMDLEKTSDTAAVFEKTIEGDCEVQYDVTTEKKSTIVTKSVNFEKCSRRADIRYNMRFSSECPECEHSQAVVPQSSYTYTFNEEQLKKVEGRAVYQVTLKNQLLMKSEIRTLLSLVEASPISREMKAPRGEKQELIYSTEWDQVIERFYKNGDNVEEKPFEESDEKTAEIKKTIEKLSNVEEQNPEALQLIQHLVVSLRKCSEAELRKVHDEILPQLEKKTQNILEQSLAIAGTKNTIQHLIRHIENEDISAHRASQLFKSIQETLYPSEEIARVLHQFVSTEVCRRSPALRQSVWLCYGAVVRGVVSPVLEKQLIKENSSIAKNKFLTSFKNEFEQSKTTYDKVLIIKSLANAAIDIAVTELERIVLNKREESVVRREAIDALRLIGERMPRKVQRLLMPVYSARLEKPEIRMSALVQLLQSKPDISLLSQIVNVMEREPNHQVSALTYRMLSSLSKSTNPCERRVSSDMKVVLRASLFRPQEQVYSYYQRLPLFSYEAFSGINVNFATVFGMESAMPKDFMASMDTLFSGDWSKYFMQIGFSQQNIEQLYSKIVRVFEKMSNQESLRERSPETLKYLKNLGQKMNIKSRNVEREEPFTMLYFRYKQMDYAMLPLDESILENLAAEYLRNGFFDLSRLNIDTEFNFAQTGFFFEYTHQIPTILGVPLRVTAGSPSVLTAEGSFSVKKTSYGAIAAVTAKSSVAVSFATEMKIFSPILEQGVKLTKDLDATIPLHAELEINMKKGYEIKLRQSLPTSQKNLINISSKPVAFVRISSNNKYALIEPELKTIQISSWKKRSQEFEHKLEILDQKFTVFGTRPQKWELQSVILGDYEMSVEVNPTSAAAKDVAIRIAFDSFEEARIQSATVEKMMEKTFEIEHEEWKSSDITERREHIQKLARGLNEGYKHRMTVSVETGRKVSELELLTEVQRELKFFRLSVNGRCPAENREWTVKSILEVIMPESVATLEQIKEQKHKEILAHWESKWGSSDKNEVVVKIQLEQNQEIRRWIQNLREGSEGLSTYELLDNAARLNQLKAVIDYKLATQTEKTLTHIFESVKSYTFWSSKSEKVEGEQRRVFVELTVQPIRSYANLTVQTPEQLWKMSHVQLPYVVLPSIAQGSSARTELKKFASSECVVKSNKIRSFDDVIFATPLTTCYSVVAKDCSEEPRYAVLVRKVLKSGEEKKVKIVADSTYEIELIDGELIALVNGKKLNRESEFESYRIEKINSRLFMIELDDIVVRFDGYTLRIELNKSNMNTHCGLCGHFDGQKHNDFRTADDYETEDIESFHRSFLVKHEECEIEENKLSDKKNYKVYDNEYEEDYQKDNQRDYESNENDYVNKKNGQKEPTEVTIVFEQKNQLCFSTEPVRQCPKTTKPATNVEEKIEFNCISRDSVAAKTIKSTLARKSVLTALPRGMKMSYVSKTISIPRACEVY